MKDCWSSKRQERARDARPKTRSKATRAKDLEVPRVYLGLRTLSTGGKVETLGHHGRDCRNIAIVGEGGTGEDNRPWNAQHWGDQQPEPETHIAQLEVCGCVLSVVKRMHRTLTCAQ